MDFTAVYPKIEPKKNARKILRMLFGTALFFACLTVGIVNLCIGGSPWALYVIGGAAVLWVALLYQPLVEYSLLHWLAAFLPTLCAYLFLIDFLANKTGFSGLVVPVILFSILILCTLFFFVHFKRQKHNVSPIFSTAALSLALIIMAALELFHLRFTWPFIVLAAADGLLLLLSLFFFWRPLLREFKKKFHTR